MTEDLPLDIPDEGLGDINESSDSDLTNAQQDIDSALDWDDDMEAQEQSADDLSTEVSSDAEENGESVNGELSNVQQETENQEQQIGDSPADTFNDMEEIGVPETSELVDIQEDVDQTLDSDRNNDLANIQEQQAIYDLSQIEEVQPEIWSELGETERLEVAQEIEDTMAEIQGRPPMEIEVDPSLKPGEYGGYDGHRIIVSDWSLQSNNVKELVDTIVHEGRHAYQEYAILTPDFHSNESEVTDWGGNFPEYGGTYYDASTYGQEIYESQPIEADAWSYGSRIANGIYGN